MTKRIVIAAALLIVVLLVGWYEGFYSPENSHISALKTKQETTAATLAQHQLEYVSLIASKKRLPEEEAALAKLRRAVPTGPELDKLETTLFSAAAKSGVQLESITSPQPSGFGTGLSTGASAPAGSVGPAQLDLTMTVAGSPGEITQLYRVLDAEPRLFVIDTFAIPENAGSGTGASKGAEVSETISLRAFYGSSTSQTAGS